MTANFKPYIAKYEQALLKDITPFWERHCVDAEFGGYFSCLDEDGSVYDTEKFMWMQWRIVYMFATLADSEYAQPQWLDIARGGYDFLYRHGKDEDGNYYFALNRQGAPTAVAHSIFSECFAAMGSAALFKATKEIKYRAEAESAMAKYMARLRNPKGPWNKALAGRPERQALGPQMILSNLGHVLSENLGAANFEADALQATRTALDKFWNPELKLLFENINIDGSFDLGSCEGRLINPGHGLEAMAFAMELAHRHHDQAMLEKAAMITRRLLEFGWDKEQGGIYYFLDALGKPPRELSWNMKLWWVHNEALVAALQAYVSTGDKVFWEWFEKLDAWTWKHFPDQKNGEWYGYLNRDGSVSLKLKGGQWKTFFHLPRYLLVCLRLMKAAGSNLGGK